MVAEGWTIENVFVLKQVKFIEAGDAIGLDAASKDIFFAMMIFDKP